VSADYVVNGLHAKRLQRNNSAVAVSLSAQYKEWAYSSV
jgi:hypothetical protein